MRAQPDYYYQKLKIEGWDHCCISKPFAAEGNDGKDEDKNHHNE
jgi:hypothetical protein